MKPRFAVTISLILIIFLLLQFYIGWHGSLWLSAGLGFDFSRPGTKVIYWVVYWFIALSYLLVRLGHRFLPIWAQTIMKWLGSYWLAMMMYCVLLLPVADLVYWLLRWTIAPPPDEGLGVLGLAVLVVLLVLLLRGSWNAWRPIVRTYDITIPKSAGGLESLTIAAASDLHLGSVVGNPYLRLLVSKLNGLKPDLILLPGDIIDDDIKPFIRKRMGDILKGLSAPYGVFAVLGNHEYIGGHIEEFAEEMKKAGIQLLMDRAVQVEDKFVVIGRKDRAVARFRNDKRLPLEELLSGVDRSLPLILMDHQPYHLDQSAAQGIDLSLSGHTHRGQMAPNHLITRRLFELDWGYLKKGSMHAIVSSGYGSWGPPIRLGSRSEIVQIRIRFEGKNI